MTSSNRITIYECPEFAVELEYNSDYVIWHTRIITKFSIAASRKMRKLSNELESFLRLHYPCLWTAMDPERADLARLAMMGGFKFHSHSEGLDIYRKEWKEL